MARSEQQFWDAFRERWRSDAPELEQSVVRSVFTHLARRLQAPEVEHIREQLPRELRIFWPGTEPDLRPERGQPIERTDFEDIVPMVTDETGLPDNEAVRAIHAVFHGLARVLEREERIHLSTQLPSSLRSVWDREAA